MNKYYNQVTIVNGKKYDSKAEAVVAQELEIRRKAREIRRWTSQFAIEFRVRGKCFATHFVDFMIEYPDGQRELREVKGVETGVWKLKRRMMFAFYGIDESHIRYKRRTYRYTIDKVGARWQGRYANYCK